MQAEEHGAPRHVTANGPAHGRDMTMGPDWGAMQERAASSTSLTIPTFYACSLVILNVTTRYSNQEHCHDQPVITTVTSE